jgi:hypothetical protein
MKFELCCGLSIFIQLLSEILDNEKKFMEIVISWSIAGSSHHGVCLVDSTAINQSMHEHDIEM